MPLFPSFPDDAIVKDAYPVNPKLFRIWCEVEEAIMRWPSAFSAGERELMGAYCSSLNECTYCYSSHSEAALPSVSTAPFSRRSWWTSIPPRWTTS